jgi:hypothetical protein
MSLARCLPAASPGYSRVAPDGKELDIVLSKLKLLVRLVVAVLEVVTILAALL